jgi:hypothetical protein
VTRRSPKENGAGDDRPARPESAGAPGSVVQGAPLKPLRFVERELTRPDGSTVRVKVPVYPPFRLEDRSTPPSAPDPRKQAPARRKAS